MSDRKSFASEEFENVKPLALTSVEKFVHIPVVEDTLGFASRLYGRVKNSNSLLKWTLNTAETAMTKAAETAKPVSVCLERPIKAVDTLLYTGLDYIEHKVPAVTLPSQQIIENTQECIRETMKPVLEYACAVKDYSKRKLKECNIISFRATYTHSNIENSENDEANRELECSEAKKEPESSQHECSTVAVYSLSLPGEAKEKNN